MSTSHRPLRLVLVADADGYAARVTAELAADPAPPDIVCFSRFDDALRHLANADAECVLLDLELPGASVERVLAVCPEVPVVVLTGQDDDAATVRLIRAGAQDHVLKGSESGGALMRAVRHAVERRRTGERHEVERLVRVAARRGSTDDDWLLQSIVEGTSDAVFVKDLEGRYVLLNAAAATVFGRPAEDVLGRTDVELFGEDDTAVRRARDQAVMASGQTRRYWRTWAVDGEERTMSVVKSAHRDRHGRVIGIVVTMRDESHMRRLQEESARFFELAPDMLCTAGPDGRLERMNEAWTAVLGWTPDELRAQPLLGFVHPDDRARSAGELERMLAGKLEGCACRLATKDGGWRDVEWTARAVPQDHRVYAVVRDVTDRNKLADALAAGEERYRTLVHNLPNSSVATYDHELRFTFAAGEALAVAGLDQSVIGRTLADVLPEHAEELTPRYRAALAGETQSFEFAGTFGDYWVQMTPLRDGDGTIVGGMVLSQVITQLREAQREAAQAEERFRTAFEEAPIGMGLVAPDGRYLRVNKALCAITGYTPVELLQTTVDAITHPDDVENGALGRGELLAGRTAIHRVEKRYRHADGHWVWVSVNGTLVRDADGNPSYILGQIQDITERRLFEDRLQHLVDHDPLTGLFNRRRFEEELDRHVARISRYGPEGALLVLDLDDFKLVNDTLGHSAGDDLIVAVARLLKAQLRDTDVLARLGGDEFAVIMPAGGRSEAEVVAAKLVRAVREEATVIGMRRRRRVTTSVGVALFESGDLSSAEMLVNADVAMYEAKEAGRDRYAVYAAGRADEPRERERLRWVERIRDALEEDRFVLHAQPIVDLRSGEIAQHELLVRMRDDYGDLIPPGAFLQVAERFELIQQIDRWVARRALGLIAEHADESVRLTVNLSGRSFTDERLLADLELELERTGADPSRLTFEVTETAAVANIQQAREFAERARAIGCRFALDDFGSGFGSFYYLKHLPFDYLKIDGEFVSNCLSNRTDQLVIRAVVDIAQGLGKETVAEFVSGPELVEFLREQGVDYAQGFHIGHPRPVAEALVNQLPTR